MKITSHPSPNHGARPAGVTINAVILHADASSNAGGTLDWLSRKESGVSYHFLIGRTGKVYHLVETGRRAWHAGKSVLDGVADCNDYSIGVAFSNRNDGKEPYPEAQLAAGAELVAHLMEKFPQITLDRVVRHRDVSPNRKTDPAPPAFDLAAFRLRVDGLRWGKAA